MTTAIEPRRHAPSLTDVPPFEPHPWLWNGHLQTIAARYLTGPSIRLRSTYHEIELADSDRLSVLVSTPAGWSPGRPSALLVHGLGGCARSPYVVRVAARLVGLGIRAIRMNLRGAGSGFGSARGFYHAGRTSDLRAVADWLNQRTPGSPIALVGFSLGANLVLKLAAEAATEPLDSLDCVLAANPPIDLAACCREIRRRENRIYDRNFLRNLCAEVARLHAVFPELGPVPLSEIRSLFEFDDLYTAPRNGYQGAGDYYDQNSSAPLIPQIRVPGLVVHAEDDPFIPADSFRQVAFPPGLALELNSKGGHLGYFSRNDWDGDRRWLEARLASWLAARWWAILPAREDVSVGRTPSRWKSGGKQIHARNTL
jgi:predicted alpha/beta-fold hydrolase